MVARLIPTRLLPTRIQLRFIWVFVSALLTLGAAALAFEGMRRAAEDRDAVTGINNVRIAGRSLLIALLDAETGQRGYLITDDEAYLQVYERALATAGTELATLIALTEQDPLLRGSLFALRPLVEQKLTELRETVRLARAGERAAAIALVRSDLGKNVMDGVRDQLTEMRAIATRMSNAREAAYRRATFVTQLVLGVGCLAAVLIALVAMSRLRRDVRHLEEAHATIGAQTQQLATQTEVLARSNQDLDQFAYVASHDLKAPLRGIASLAQWIEEDLGDRVTDESREHLRLMRGRVVRLEKLIDGILAYSRAGRTRAPDAPVAVGKLVRDAIDLLAPPANVTITVADGLPTLRTAATELSQVFANLISNALKHGTTDAGGTIRVEGRPGERGWIFSVVDGGPGIAPEFHERIFRVFQTLAPRDKVESTGIGLAVVKKLVEARGGRVWIESTPGQGARFSFVWRELPTEGVRA